MVRPGGLVDAYRRAVYRLERGVELRVGVHSQALAGIYREFGCECAAFLTAYNPGSVRKPDTVNALAQQALVEAIDLMGLPRLAGIGLDADPASDWPGEPSVLVPGIGRDMALALAARFGQLAILWCPPSAIPQLVFIDDALLALPD